ncbi:hypothetical protein ACHQM5_024367 [Ranunculus cassubicifolius]
MILSYANSSQPSNAFLFFATQMRELTLNDFTFQFLLKSSSKLKCISQVTQVHLLILKLGFDGIISLMNFVLHCYVLCSGCSEGV